MASSTFSENVDLLGSIRSILENYPFSTGLFRELISNAEDAKATEQIFALDRRTHPSGRIYNSRAVELQGPALLAFNNASFLPEDWVALQNISQSSKREDTSKIGKFGLGIRSCYHITDFLQILSGQTLAIFDPQRSFIKDGGIRFSFEPNLDSLDSVRDHFHAFDHFLPDSWNGEPFDGTIIRLPLRTEPGDIREKTVSPEEIEQLFGDFIQHEINISMLFLQHLRSIKLIVIEKEGTVRQLGSCTISTTLEVSDGFCKKSVYVDKGGNSITEEWLIANLSSPQEDALTLLSARAGSLSEKVLAKHKLLPNVGMAFPLDPNVRRDIGQLFTFLRLPLPTGFPAHVHAFFALTPSRQNLRHHSGNDVVKGFDDQILDEWNKLLFEVFIPRTWASFLAILPEHFPNIDILSAWPIPHLLTTYGESVYWELFPQNVLDVVLKNDPAIWPALNRPTCYALKDICIAPPQIDIVVIQALSNVGLNVCKPVPEYLFEMIGGQGQWQHRILTPESTSRILKEHFISRLSEPDVIQTADFGAILQFLLSSGNLNNIAGLPMVPTVSGGFVALVEAGSSAVIHTLLQSDNFELFRPCDEDAIYLDHLPTDTVPLFRTRDPSTLNVRLLDSNKVVEYLSSHPTLPGTNLATAQIDSDAIAFLSRFWVWIDTWIFRSQLMPQLEPLHLLPCASGLKQANRRHPILKPSGIDQGLSDYLSQLGVPFVAPTLEASAQEALEKYGFLKSVCDIDILLDCLGHSTVNASSEDAANALLMHFNGHMVKCDPTAFTNTRAKTFTRLPIFPVVGYQEVGTTLTLRRRRIPVEGLSVYGITSFEFIPTLPNTVFVDATILDRRILPFLNESRPSPLSDMGVLDLCFRRLDRQPKRLLAKMLQHLVSRRSWMTSSQMESLCSERFILSAAGSLQMPRKLIDPLSPLYPLYVDDHQRIPRREDELDRQIVASLSALNLLDRAINVDNVTDRIGYIASNPFNDSSFQHSIQLLNILYEQGFACNTLNLDRSIAWLPIQAGSLATAQQCRPGQNTSTDELYLFDHVLDLVHTSAKVSPSLPRMLGWADPIPIDTLINQFRLVLEANGHDVYPRVKRLIKELATRDLTLVEQASLRAELEDRDWVPTSEYGRLVQPWQAVVSSPFSGIWEISPDLVKTGAASFLASLGCLNVPSFDTINRRLRQLSSQRPCDATTVSAIAVLKYVADSPSLHLSEQERPKLLVPDTSHRLRLIQDIVFNDVGPRAALVKRDGTFHLANDYVDDSLAQYLGLERLGTKYVHLQTPGEDMGVTPATVVKKTLKQYTERQFLPEFLANAEDAGASRLVIIVNDYSLPAVSGGFLSSQLETLCSGPSVMIYNDKEFSEQDFEGICRTHVGSKAGDPQSIGQFGLGALTMFHITECATIYSGEKVLFLDPSKTHLPLSERASLLVPLANLLEWYPGHEKCLEGLEYFDKAAHRVKGTIFFLPLRKESHFVGRSPFVPDVYSIEYFGSRILQDFKSKAPDSLLFIDLSHIEARSRTSADTSQMLWCFTARRSQTDCGEFSELSISIQEKTGSGSLAPMEWLTVSASFSAAAIPPEYNTNNSSKIFRVGLAAPMDKGNQLRSKFFFSTLPLAIPVSLPVHVNASFRLSSDRRQIRLDTYDNDDTRFNRWLLTDKLSPLYIELLERIGLKDDNSRWWPGAPLGGRGEDDETVATVQEDSLTAVLMDSFYSKLATSTRRVFPSKYTEGTLEFSDIVLYPSHSPIPTVIKQVLDILRPASLTKLSETVRRRVKQAGAKVLSPAFVQEVLLTDGGAESIREQLGATELDSLLMYLSSDPTLLDGLPLLFLADGTWATFETDGEPYYSWPAGAKSLKRGFLPPGRFISTETMPDELLSTLHKSAIRVVDLDADALKKLVEEKLERLSPEDIHVWVMSFWREFRQFPQTRLLESIETLALIPRTDAPSFISLIQCKEDAIFLSDSSDGEVREYLQALGISVVEMDRLPPELREQLRYSEYAPGDTIFSQFLRCITPILNPATSILRSWAPDKQEAFSEWVRSNIRDKLQNSTARKLPVWIARKGDKTTLCSADEVTLLPMALRVDMGRFCSRFVTGDPRVFNLGNSRIAISDLSDILQIPDSLDEGSDESIYLSLFDQLLNSDRIDTLRVPNAHRAMVEPADLFERTPFFVAAFGEGAFQFLLHSFDRFASRLYSRGLKRENDLNITVFAQCARALHQDQATNKLDRGRTVFDMYCETLPLHIHSNQAMRWHELDQLRFIPRNGRTTRQYGSQEIELPVHIRELPTLVSPQEVVRSKFYDIAWTQRVALAEEPIEGERLLFAYPKFGCPCGAEVIAHMKELIKLPRGPVVVHDLEATYKWLNENVHDIEALCAELRDEPIFLNVADPNIDEWEWFAASQLALETHDLSNIQGVRQFLAPFRDFLKATGVLEAIYPDLEQEDEATSTSREQVNFRQMRDRFAKMRMAGLFTDVAFDPVPEVASEVGPSSVHSKPRGHRNFLAACSSTFEDMFTGDYAESQESSSTQPLIVPLPYPHLAIETTLDYLYTGGVSWGMSVGLDDLLETLGLASYLDIEGLFSLVQREIIMRRMVDPNNLDYVRDCAEELSANTLRTWCDDYEETNQNYINAVQSSASTSTVS